MKLKRYISKIIVASVIIATLSGPFYSVGIYANQYGETEIFKEEANFEEDINQEDSVFVDKEENEEIVKVVVEDVVTKPGDIFYLFKILTEKIRMALTFDDVQKAKLLIEFTEERIKEAEELFINGDEELAYETLERALKHQDLALEYSEKIEEKEEEIQQDIDNQDNTVESRISTNILALTKAMERVKNPKAKQALARNIERATRRMERLNLADEGANIEVNGIEEELPNEEVEVTVKEDKIEPNKKDDIVTQNSNNNILKNKSRAVQEIKEAKMEHKEKKENIKEMKNNNGQKVKEAKRAVKQGRKNEKGEQ
ncbi:DUF5667 domain-containing protein [Alkalithermobacter paradoxus]|uniref:DUF5667 domain-containing protein n=1 Tax=Alkalithermobacter paradoxus TaxID=29349 RepID=A0A1V4I8Z4_9FIRM|nr:hypothetical protein CLOTH_08670 [[Clostridium] thermoalcaliphilum]